MKNDKVDERAKKTYSLTRKDKDDILEKWDYICAYCFGPADQVDHVIPQAFIVDHAKDNLVSCCWLCNLIASDRVFRSFEQKKKYIIDRRYKFIKSHTIPLWLRGELKELRYVLRKKIEKQCLVLENYSELMATKKRLLAEGWKVSYNQG